MSYRQTAIDPPAVRCDFCVDMICIHDHCDICGAVAKVESRNCGHWLCPGCVCNCDLSCDPCGPQSSTKSAIDEEPG